MLSFILDRTVGGPATASKILVPYLEKRVPAILGKHAEAVSPLSPWKDLAERLSDLDRRLFDSQSTSTRAR